MRVRIVGPPALLQTPPKKPLTLWKATGCGECLGGYKGRVGVLEGLFVDETIERLVLESPPPQQLREAALAAGMIPLRQDALLKVLAGTTSLEEVARVVGEN